MEKPLVSVMMITYNHAPFIRQAIEGVLQQKTDFLYELVIGEDCSTDGTREIVFQYQKKYPGVIRVVTSATNVGAQQNAHRSLKSCYSKYIAFCEGDDYWQRSDKLQIQVDHMEEHPDYGLVYSDFDRYSTKSGYTENNHVKSTGCNILNPQMLDIVTHKTDIRTCTVLANRELVEQITDADPYLHINGHFKMGDMQLWAEILHVSKIHFIDESLATYRIQEESATQNKDRRKRLEFWISDAEMYLYLCKKYNLPESVKKQHEKDLRRRSLILAFIEKRMDLAEAAREKYPELSLKDRLWYLGTKYTAIRPFIILLKMAIRSSI